MTRSEQTSMTPNLPIGVFDSGVGGLTVVRALMERLPFENIIYFGDTARVPYGIKSVDIIEQFTAEITDFLLARGVKLLIIACNTMAAVAQEIVKTQADKFGVPVIDVIAAGADAAAHLSRSGHIGVIGTPTTINSNAYAQRIHAASPHARVYSQACPLFVPLVEEGWLDHQVTRLTAQEYLRPVLAENIDTLVLGCTHYPLLKPLLLEITDNQQITLVDSALTVAEAAATTLGENRMINEGRITASTQYFVTDIPLRFQTIGERFLGRTLNKVEKIELPTNRRTRG